MTIRIANIDFDRVNYDEQADVLYLASDDPERAVDFDETPEGHACPRPSRPPTSVRRWWASDSGFKAVERLNITLDPEQSARLAFERAQTGLGQAHAGGTVSLDEL